MNAAADDKLKNGIFVNHSRQKFSPIFFSIFHIIVCTSTRSIDVEYHQTLQIDMYQN